MRLDMALVAKGLTDSRTKAQELIKNKKVLRNDVLCEKASAEVSDTDNLSITENLKYVSRGGHKLETALEIFNLNPKEKVCADIGASTGGFTDCLIQGGAKRVYAVDVGTDQLINRIKQNKRVISLEKTDIRNLQLQEEIDLSVVDVSFISLTHVLKDVAKITKSKGNIVALIKPQFEVGREHILKNGIADPDFREFAIKKVCDYASMLGLLTKGVTESPILGGNGNMEFLAWFGKTQ